MQANIRITHKDVDITYEEDINKWCINRYDRDSRQDFDSLKAAKAALDRQLKIKYIEESVWVLGGSSRWDMDNFANIKQCIATRPHRKDEVWIKDATGKRAVSKEIVFLDTNANRKLFMQIAEQERLQTEARKKARALKDQLECIGEMKVVE
jgi:hypothetical protein